MALEDRILELALESHFGEQRTPDHTREIVGRWQAGAVGSLRPAELAAMMRALAAEPRHGHVPEDWGGPVEAAPEVDRERGSSRSHTRLLRTVILAACLGGIALGLAFWRSHDRAPVPDLPFATVTGAVQVLGATGFVARTGNSLESGDTILVVHAPATVALESGGMVQALSPALFKVGEDGEGIGIELLDGTLRLEAGAEPLWLRTIGTSLELEAGSTVRMEFASMAPRSASKESRDQSGQEPSPEASVPSVARLDWNQVVIQAHFDAPDRALLVTSVAGRVVVDPEGLGLVLPSTGDALCLARGLTLSVADRLLFLELAAQMLPEEYRIWNPRIDYEPARKRDQRLALVELLGRIDGLWNVFERRIAAVRTLDYSSRDYLPALLDLLLDLGREDALFIARAIWLEEPEAFLPEHIVSLAERGAFEFEREVRARVELWSLDVRNLEGVPFYSAVFLALRGDDAGRLLLEQVLERSTSSDLSNGNVALAALGLEGIGGSGAWEQAARRMALEVERELRKGDLRIAMNLALTLEAASRLGRNGPEGLFPGLRDAILRERSARSQVLASEAEIRAILDEHGWR